MSDKKKMHTDSSGNEHFNASEAEWADRDIREKKKKKGDGSSSFGEIFVVVWAVVLFGCYKLYHDLEKAMIKHGYSAEVSDITGKVAGIALLIVAITLVVKAGTPLDRALVCLLYLLIAVAGFILF